MIKHLLIAANNNFAVASALATAITVSILLIFLQAYLAIFDWTLIWYLEYPDILKLLLVTVALVASVFAPAFNLMEAIFNALSSGTWKARLFWIIALLVPIIGASMQLFLEVRAGSGKWSFYFALIVTYAGLIGIVVSLDRMVSLVTADAYDESDRAFLANQLFAVVAFFGGLGSLFGHYVRDISNVSHDALVKAPKGEIVRLTDVKTIIAFSHHTAFWHNGKAYVYQTPDIFKLESGTPAKAEPAP